MEENVYYYGRVALYVFKFVYCVKYICSCTEIYIAVAVFVSQSVTHLIYRNFKSTKPKRTQTKLPMSRKTSIWYFNKCPWIILSIYRYYALKFNTCTKLGKFFLASSSLAPDLNRYNSLYHWRNWSNHKWNHVVRE